MPLKSLSARLSLALSIALVVLVAGAPRVLADPGPAPAPREYRVLQKLHTDAISTFLDAGAFRLGSKADVPEGLGTRLDPDRVWFHVDDASKLTVPAGMEFLAPAGTEVWVAPQSNPSGSQLWPGFSTESVPAGAIDGDQTTLRLVKLEGPGALELFTTGGFGERTRLWSSDEQLDSFRIGRTHMHANWAFTKAGTYALTVEGSAQRGGQPVSGTATYTFVVGPLAEAARTSTTLTATPATVAVGERVDLAATVAPASAAGFVEFKAGTTVLGHARAVNGQATLGTTTLGVGGHQVTAEFVPEVLNRAGRSTSAPVVVTVTDEPGGQPFGVAGIAASYQPGDLLAARVVGATLGADQNYQWRIRPIGTTGTGSTFTGTGTEATTGRVQQPMDPSYSGYELSARLRTGTTVVAQTDWVPIRVTNAAEPLTAAFTKTGPIYLGEEITVKAAGRALAADESLRLVQRTSGLWSVIPWATAIDPITFKLEPLSASSGLSYALQVLRDGQVVAQSEPFAADIRNREILVDGLQSVYRVGQTLRATGTVYPELPGVKYSWLLIDLDTFTTTVLKEGTDAAARTLELPMTLAHDRTQLTFAATWDYGPEVVYVGQKGTAINVSAADPSTQLFFFNRLGDHYHQGSPLNLKLIADPAPAAGDQIAWEWKWAGQDWTAFPGANALERPIVVEQALDGVQVRAKLTFAGGGTPLTAEPVTIHVDDHGAAANQKVTIAGETAHQAGDEATLTAAVAPATILDRYQWYDGDTPIPGATSERYTFTATQAHDGRALRVAVLKPNGEVAYGPSAAVTLAVSARSAATEQPVHGTVPATLSLTLGTPASFGTLTPGVTREYKASTTATVTSSAGDATLTVSDQSGDRPGHLVNGAFALAAPLQGLGTLKTYGGPVANDAVTVELTQPVAATDPLRTGAYSKALTFTLSTTTP